MRAPKPGNEQPHNPRPFFKRLRGKRAAALIAPIVMGTLAVPAGVTALSAPATASAAAAKTTAKKATGVGTSGSGAKAAGTPAAGSAGLSTPSFKKPKAIKATKGTRRQKVAPYTVSPASASTQAKVTLSTMVQIPRSYLGLSINNDEVPDYTDYPAAFDNFIKLLTPADDGPFILRFGGTQADESYWENDESTVNSQYQVSPSHAIQLTTTWLQSIATVLQNTGSKLYLNVNAAAHDPQMAVDYLRAAEQILPKNSLIGTLVGNEPDLYSQPSVVPIGQANPWTMGFGAAQYATLYGQYARVLNQAFPNLTVGGPEVGGPKANWISTLLNQDPGQAGLITTHVYPWNSCYAPSSPHYPQVGYYLISSYPQQTAQTVAQTVQLATQQGEKVRLTELGSATCGGTAGVNNTFAVSLWAINQLFDFMQAGVSGINIHIRADLPNTALQSLNGTLTASPFFYGAATVAEALSGGGRVVQVNGNLPANVTLWAVQSTTGWHLVYVNGNATAQTVVTHIDAKGPLTENLLTAPSPSSTTATLAGQTISNAGTWQGTLQQTSVPLSNGTYTVSIPADSAILATAATRIP